MSMNKLMKTQVLTSVKLFVKGKIKMQKEQTG